MSTGYLNYGSNVQNSWEKLWDERSIPIDFNKTYKYQPMWAENPKKEDNFENVLKGIYGKNLLTLAFFSNKNIDNLEKQLRYVVWLMSDKQYVLSPQNKTELVIIMRSIFLNYSTNLNCNIKEQIFRLNNIVIRETAPDLLSNTTQYLRFLEDKNESHKVLIARPINVNKKGIRTLDMSSAIGF